jgi:ABC-type transport system involved in cytochrome bd biosynthesis fused ATPase/permease subunit
VQEVERGVAVGVLGEIRNGLVLLPLAVLLVILAPRLAVSGVVAFGAFGLLAFGLRRAFKAAHARATRTASALVATADDAVRHAELWATYGAKRRITDHLARVSRAIVRESAELRVRAAVLSSTSEVLGALALVLVLWLGGKGALGVDRATLVPFAIAFFMAYRPLRDFVEARLARARGDAALGAARAEGRGEGGAEEPSSRAPSRVAAWPLATLELRDVEVRRGRFAPISAVVPPGAVLAIVGPTGIGKTSLLRALLGLEATTRGHVRYGDRFLDVAGVGPSERPFAWVPQDAPLVADTLAVNVALGGGDAGGEPDPAPLLAELGAGALAKALGDAVLGPGGVRAVSGGERQWIALARALASGLPVLLLDEPTSALDGPAQARLLESLARLRRSRTVVLVTHRPEPLAIADVVVRLSAALPEDDERGAGGDRDVVGA